MLEGSFTALITPFLDGEIDHNGLDRLIEFQIAEGISGILAVGTTGESPVLSWDEHNAVVEKVAQKTKGRCACIAGAGSNNTQEALTAAGHAAEVGVDAVLLVDPYYNGPSSLEIRREYVAPVARACPGVQVIPYVIPGRTGAQLLPEDLALLSQEFDNVQIVKEATGSLENMKRTRTCCGSGFNILSGDDAVTLKMMQDPAIKAGGVISVASNLVPGGVTAMVKAAQAGEMDTARKLVDDMTPLFNLVTVTTKEKTTYGAVTCRARNPLAFKTLMAVLGLPAGGCRQPLGKMTRQGLDVVLTAGRQVMDKAPQLLAPAAEFFGVDIEKRLNDPACWQGLFYENY